jgi:hypothetical protein
MGLLQSGDGADTLGQGWIRVRLPIIPSPSWAWSGAVATRGVNQVGDHAG